MLLLRVTFLKEFLLFFTEMENLKSGSREWRIKRAYDMVDHLDVDFPEIKNIILTKKESFQERASILKKYFRENPEQFGNLKEKGYSSHVHIISKALRFLCMGYQDEDEGNFGYKNFEGNFSIEEMEKYEAFKYEKMQQRGVGAISQSREKNIKVAMQNLQIMHFKGGQQPWNESELEKLINLTGTRGFHKKGIPIINNIAKELERTPASVASQLNRIKDQEGFKKQKRINWCKNKIVLDGLEMPLLLGIHYLSLKPEYQLKEKGKVIIANKKIADLLISKHGYSPEQINGESLGAAYRRNKSKIPSLESCLPN